MSKTKHKPFEQRALEQELYFDKRYRARTVTSNMKRTTSKQKLRRMIEENDYERD